MKTNLLFFVAVVLLAGLSWFPAWSNAETEKGGLDLSQYEETFSETFETRLDVTSRSGPSRWIAHTPYNGDFGAAAFADPSPRRKDFPFQTGKGGLKITARKNWRGKWESGLLSSVDTKGRGFRQAGGYFEAKIKMPDGPGLWPAFWLLADGHPAYKAEIDIVEYYGHRPEKYEIAFHDWPKDKTQKDNSTLKVVKVPFGSLTKAFHTYGVEINKNEIIYYLDRKEVGRVPATESSQYPMYMLVDLALVPKWPLDKTPSPSVMEIEYIKAFQRKER